VKFALPPKRPEPKNETRAFYGPRWLWKRLDEIAAQTGRSKSELVVGILEQWLKGFESKRKR
jgi:predicted DNA-binding protein